MKSLNLFLAVTFLSMVIFHPTQSQAKSTTEAWDELSNELFQLQRTIPNNLDQVLHSGPVSTNQFVELKRTLGDQPYMKLTYTLTPEEARSRAVAALNIDAKDVDLNPYRNAHGSLSHTYQTSDVARNAQRRLEDIRVGRIKFKPVETHLFVDPKNQEQLREAIEIISRKSESGVKIAVLKPENANAYKATRARIDLAQRRLRMKVKLQTVGAYLGTAALIGAVYIWSSRKSYGAEAATGKLISAPEDSNDFENNAEAADEINDSTAIAQ